MPRGGKTKRLWHLTSKTSALNSTFQKEYKNKRWKKFEFLNFNICCMIKFSSNKLKPPPLGSFLGIYKSLFLVDPIFGLHYDFKAFFLGELFWPQTEYTHNNLILMRTEIPLWSLMAWLGHPHTAIASESQENKFKDSPLKRCSVDSIRFCPKNLLSVLEPFNYYSNMSCVRQVR